jgi:Flp pilus assembly pilin Flp
MRQLMSRLWKDDCGAMLAVEWVFVATILVIGSITGLVAVRQAIIQELEEFAEAVLSLSTSWNFHDDSGDDEDSGHRHHRHHGHSGHRGHEHEGDDFNRHLASFHHGEDD